MCKKMMKKLLGLRNRASLSWGHSWPRLVRQQVIKFDVHSLLDSRLTPVNLWKFLHHVSGIGVSLHEFELAVHRTWGSAEVCAAFPDFHQQGQGCTSCSLSAGPVSWHGGSHRARGGVVSWMHWVGQGWEKNLPTTGPGGEDSFFNIETLSVASSCVKCLKVKADFVQAF